MRYEKIVGEERRRYERGVGNERRIVDQGQYMVSSSLALLFFFFSGPRRTMSCRIQGIFCPSIPPGPSGQGP